MAEKAYAIVGSWNFKPSQKGFGLFGYDEKTGELNHIKHYDSQVSAGQHFFDKKRNILYVVDECEGKPDSYGGGGFVRSYLFDHESEEFEFLNEKCVFMTKPAYFWLDISGRYAVVAPHTGRGVVTKVVKHEDGSYGSETLFDDVGIVLMKINDDGSLGDVCDVILYDGITENKAQVHAHPHSIVGSPNCEIYFACDKGLDMIYSYKIDREKAKLIALAETKMEYMTAPRYSAFHPTLPILFENNETSNDLFAFKYDENTGVLEIVSKVKLCGDSTEKISPSDVLVSPDGKYLYASVRGVNEIAVFSIEQETGALDKVQNISTEGSPRGLCISPDRRFLFAAYCDISSVACFSVSEDGRLLDTGKSYFSDYAANMSIITY